MLEDKNQVLGVIHGAQPAMGAPAAYKRQKAGFEAHSFLERLVSSVLGDDGPEVRAIFPYGYGPLELLPCQYYHDPNLEEGAWFSYQTFVNGEIKTTHVPSERIYDDVYTKFDDECYYGMLNRDELMRGMKDINEFKKYKIYPDTSKDIVKYVSYSAEFHKLLHEGGIHQRTIQLLSRGNPTCCAVHWKLIDLTENILNYKFVSYALGRGFYLKNSDISIMKVLPREELGKNCYYEVRWIEKDWSTGACITTSNKELETVSATKIKEEIKKTGRRVALFTLTGPAQDGNPDQKNSHWSMDGDGTVPVASVLALPVSAEGWPEALKSKLPTYCRAERNTASGEENAREEKGGSRGKHRGKTYSATKLTSNAEHSGFFDNKAILATKQAIHNLCLAWLKGDIA